MRNIMSSLIELFEKHVKNNSQKLAVSDGVDLLTYNQLNEKANQLANWLESQKTTPGTIISLVLDPGIDVIIWILAIAKCGGIYLTIDVGAPHNWIEAILTNARPKLIVTKKNRQFHPKFPQINSTQVFESLAHYSSEYNGRKQNLQHPLAMFYTSGSTGIPKGVVISQGAVLNLADSLEECNKGIEVFAQFNNLGFDPSLLELWGTLLNGISLFIVPNLAKQNVQQLKNILFKNKVQAIVFPTSYLHQLIITYPDVLDSVRVVHFGGEQVNATLLRNFLNYRELAGLPLKLVNNYGPTEATAVTCQKIIDSTKKYTDLDLSSLGKPIVNVKTYILNESMCEVNNGDIGELYISGKNLALEYHNLPLLNDDKFMKNPFCSGSKFKRLYKTGDLVKQTVNGELLYIGRTDDQVKINGFRVYIGEVEKNLLKHPSISFATVLLSKTGNHQFLTAYIVLTNPELSITAEEIRNFLKQNLPDYMLPSKYLKVDRMPLTAIGKVDKKKLEKVRFDDLAAPVFSSTDTHNSIEKKLIPIWQRLLNLVHINPTVNLFELGAHSLKLAEACALINNDLGYSILIADILANPSVRKLAHYLENGNSNKSDIQNECSRLEIAIVGFSCKFPRANNWRDFWQNLCDGNDCLTNFKGSIEYPQNSLADSKKFIPVKGVIQGIGEFDATFFGYSPNDAASMDPQQRIFLECAWAALEDSGNILHEDKIISVFAGQADSTYLQENLLKNRKFNTQNDWFNARLSTSMGALSTQVSYKLDLRGKSININTACSTGLIAIEQACQDLSLGYSDIALAGSVSIDVGQRNGYYYQEHGIESKDGKCSPFSSDATGTIFSDGVGVVVLKRLSDAQKDGDTIYALVRGCGINNDGADKLGYTAPSINGQIDCIRKAIDQAKISAEKVHFVESHGTATSLGDVIEFTSLNKAHRHYTNKNNYCALGSVKSNIGHTDIAAGVAGLIKAVLCLHYKKIPPTLHFATPNSDINFNDSPFYVNTELLDWTTTATKYAGVSAFGIGGTNAHIILEEYPQEKTSTPKLPHQLLLFSAKNETSLKQYGNKLTAYLSNREITPNHFADIAYTTQTARQHFSWRQIAVGKDNQDIIRSLNGSPNITKLLQHELNIVFMFSGQGSQYRNMSLELAELFPFFAFTLNQCNDIAKTYTDRDILELIQDNPDNLINHTKYTQIALFMIECSLAKLFISLGVTPKAFIGHSIGEYVAATLAEIFSLEDAIKLVCKRGALMEDSMPGSMLSIACSLEDAKQLVDKTNFDIALHNSTQNCVIAGSTSEINQLTERIEKKGYQYRQLHVSHAFHSRLMNDAANQFEALFAGITLNRPKIPLISNTTGTWLTDEEATNPKYWSNHLRERVQFKTGIDTLVSNGYNCFLEIGPGVALTTFVKDIAQDQNFEIIAINTLSNHAKLFPDDYGLLLALGTLWQYGAKISWAALHTEESRRRVSIPTYSFQKQKHWIDPDHDTTPDVNGIDDSYYVPTWIRQANIQAYVSQVPANSKYTWLIFKNNHYLSDQLIQQLRKSGEQLFTVESGSNYSEQEDNRFTISPGEKSHYLAMLNRIKDQITDTLMVMHLYSLTELENTGSPDESQINTALDNRFYSILFLSQAHIETIGESVTMKCGILTYNAWQVLGNEVTKPLNTMLTGLCKTIPQEHPYLHFKLIDIGEVNHNYENWGRTVISYCVQDKWEVIQSNVAIRNNCLWLQKYVVTKLESNVTRLRDSGVYLCTGGLGGISLTLCEAITHEVMRPVFILIARSAFPDKLQWDDILNDSTQSTLHKKIDILRKIEENGGLVHIMQGDVSDIDCMRKIVSDTIQQYKKINGVIHAAGIAGHGVMLLKTKAEIKENFASKIHGTYNLAHALNNQKLDFVMLCSSISSIVGVVGLSDYSSANACLDGFTTSGLFNSKFTTSINWNTWKSIGMASNGNSTGVEVIDIGNNILPGDGQLAFKNILKNHYNQVAVSTMSIEYYAKMVNQHQDANPEIAEVIETSSENYVLPDNPIESLIVRQWQEILGIPRINVTDDFFVLGGHSLKALKFLETVNRELQCNLTLQQLYKYRTVEQLVTIISSKNQNNLLDSITVKLSLSRTAGKTKDIFLFHPVAGTLFCYQTIVDNFKLPFNLYGIQDPSISSGKIEFSSITEIAKVYLDKIKEIQPNGPYYFIGYSFGGTIAHEITNLLFQQSEKVNLLALIDSWAAFSDEQFDEIKFRKVMLHYNKELTAQSLDLTWQRMSLLLSHVPSKLKQDMILFKASTLLDEFKVIDDKTNHWYLYNTGHITVYNIKADHETIIYPCNSLELLKYLEYNLTN